MSAVIGFGKPKSKTIKKENKLVDFWNYSETPQFFSLVENSADRI
jgi:hypothetical protein